MCLLRYGVSLCLIVSCVIFIVLARAMVLTCVMVLICVMVLTRDGWGRGPHGHRAERAQGTKSSRPEGPPAGSQGWEGAKTLSTK